MRAGRPSRRHPGDDGGEAMREITEKQWIVLEFIRGFIRENGMPPTRKEMAAAMGWKSPNAAGFYINALKEKGALTHNPGIARGIALTDSATVNIPDVNAAEYWFDGLFQHQRYERDVYKAVEAAGMKGSSKTWGDHHGE